MAHENLLGGSVVKDNYSLDVLNLVCLYPSTAAQQKTNDP